MGRFDFLYVLEENMRWNNNVIENYLQGWMTWCLFRRHLRKPSALAAVGGRKLAEAAALASVADGVLGVP
jgi:hypothetical protein